VIYDFEMGDIVFLEPNSSYEEFRSKTL